MIRYDLSKNNEPLSKTGRIVYACFIVLLICMFLAEIFMDFEPAKLSIFFFILFWAPFLLVHEAGHAIMAKVFDCHVKMVVIGIGKIIGVYRIGDTIIELRALPLEGFVSYAPDNMELSRMKNAIVYFAGPGAEILVAIVVYILAGPVILTKSESIWIIALQSLAVTGLTGAVLNLIPQSVITEKGEMPNDGLGILKSLF